MPEVNQGTGYPREERRCGPASGATCHGYCPAPGWLQRTSCRRKPERFLRAAAAAPGSIGRVATVAGGGLNRARSGREQGRRASQAAANPAAGASDRDLLDPVPARAGRGRVRGPGPPARATGPLGDRQGARRTRTTPRTPSRPRSSSSSAGRAARSTGRGWGPGCTGSPTGSPSRPGPPAAPAKRQEARATPAGPTTPTDLSWQEACDLLHAELDRLPETYRAPLLLCYLEGKTRDEAAAALGVTLGAVKGRLERGREMLRARLARRGVTLSVGLLTAVAAPQAVGSGSGSALAAVLSCRPWVGIGPRRCTLTGDDRDPRSCRNSPSRRCSPSGWLPPWPR